jgi:hypothetical protein
MKVMQLFTTVCKQDIQLQKHKPRNIHEFFLQQLPACYIVIRFLLKPWYKPVVPEMVGAHRTHGRDTEIGASKAV